MLDSGYRVEDNSDIENAVINAAKKHYDDRNYDLAIKLYLGLLKTSASSRLYMDVGLCYYKKNDFDTAIEYLSRATILDNKNSVAFSYLGNCYFKKLNANMAIENWTTARSISPKDESVCLNLAIVYFAKEMSYESVFHYEKFLKYAQNKETNQYKSIQKNMNELFSSANDYFIQGEKADKRNNSVLAENNYLSAVKKYPTIPEYNIALGNLYYKIHQYKNALKYYEYGLRSNNNRTVILNIAKCYESLNDCKHAYCFYTRYLKFTISSQAEYLDITKRAKNLKNQIDYLSIKTILNSAQKYELNNEYYKALTEYENYTILKPELRSDYLDKINKLISFTKPEHLVTRKYIEKGKELLQKGEIKGANRYFTEVMHLSNPKSNEYRLAKSKIVNV